jgi:PAS domain S-box-containing protein
MDKMFYVNPAFKRTTGYLSHELIGKDVMVFRSEAKPRSFYDGIRESVFRHRTWAGVYPAKKKDGAIIYLELRESLIKDTSSVVVCHDITDKLRLEDELRHAHKMEAIGTLAGGVAHDFNNILAAILGFSEIALEDTEQPHVKDSLKQVI